MRRDSFPIAKMALKNIQRHHTFISLPRPEELPSWPDKRRIPCSFLPDGGVTPYPFHRTGYYR
ncbi:hypothetical protein KCP75_12300 [Salmonella enterica subsp. enterica]|nr:hypothetical protein KCP75_12300 [Salmonella enterica subsp. enterica]